MTDKLYTNLKFGFEVTVIGYHPKLTKRALKDLHFFVKNRLTNHLLNFKLKLYPELTLDEVGDDSPEIEDYYQVED